MYKKDKKINFLKYKILFRSYFEIRIERNKIKCKLESNKGNHGD